MRLAYKFLIVTLFIQSFYVSAQSELIKDYNYKYTVANTNQVLNLDNRFGSMHIETTEGNQVIIKVTVTVIQRNEKRAREVLSSILVKATESSSLISVQSKVPNNVNNKSGESFTISYNVKVPKTMILDAEQSFGDMFVQDLTSKADISVKYGNLKAENLTGSSNVNVEFGNGDIANIRDGKVVAKYSKLDLQKGGTIDLDQQFSDVTIGTLDKLLLESKYGSIDIGTVGSLDGYSNFSGFEIAKLLKSITLSATYGGGVIIKSVAKDFRQMNLTGKFTKFDISLDTPIDANLNIDTEFCNFRYNESNTSFTSRIKDSNKGLYIGRIGKGGSLISIDSSYGDIKLNY